MQSTTQKIPFDVILASLFWALFADTKIINLIVLAAWPSLAGSFMTLMYVIVVLCLFYIGLVRQRRSLLSLSSSHVMICFLCLLSYLVTTTFIGEPSVPITFFGIFTIAAFLIPGIIIIDVKTFIMALMILPSVGIFYLQQLFIEDVLENGVISMGASYALLVPVLANIIYLRFYFMKERTVTKLLMLVFAAVNLFYLMQMAMFGSRGPILCAALLIACCYLVAIRENRIIFKKGRFVVIALSIIIISFLFVPILQIISDTLAGYDISLNFVDKFLRMDDSGDMSNGRDSIDAIAWNGIWQSPVFGHGIAQFENNTGVVYPHNFILQLLYDGGFIFILAILIPIIRKLFSKFRVIHVDEFICLVFLCFASVPGALFSGDLWQSGILWMFFGFVLSKQSVFDRQMGKRNQRESTLSNSDKQSQFEIK